MNKSLILIFLFTAVVILSFFLLPQKYSISLAIIYLSTIIFYILVKLNDKYFNQQVGFRTFSIQDKSFITDVIERQMNMHSITDKRESHYQIEFFRQGKKVATVRYKLDEKGKPIKVDEKYIIEIEAPEYILHNIDHETWSLIGRKTK